MTLIVVPSRSSFLKCYQPYVEISFRFVGKQLFALYGAILLASFLLVFSSARQSQVTVLNLLYPL